MEVQPTPDSDLDLGLRTSFKTPSVSMDAAADVSRDSLPLTNVKNRQRDPQKFFRGPNDDIDNWLRHYERVSAHNKLAHHKIRQHCLLP